VVSNIFSEGPSALVVKELTENVPGGAQLLSFGSDADSSSNGDPGGDSGSVSTSFDGQSHGVTSHATIGSTRNGISAISFAGSAASGDHDTTHFHNAHGDDGGNGGEAGGASVIFKSGFVKYDTPPQMLSSMV